ncbi:MAG TPA: bifunctional precorrin-2 dehydrogenase/sirohydrochlorin ferrochelatase [Nitrospiraceae bacterium]|nr:bifunctional precorrin-2 dehydrogenase/sirohydrochlorin ferrochelatase [Nitrospiraceae bacterium]
MAANPGFPISLDVKGWPVLVIGGDDEAAEKTVRLLDAGAKVTAVSPVLNETMRKLAASAKIIHRGRHFRATDVESAILVLNLMRGDRELSQSLMALSREQRFLLWSVDQPSTSNVIMPAVVACGHLRVAINTSGQAPALSGFIKEDLEKVFGPDFSAFLDWLGELRERAKADEPDAEKRRQMLREALDGFHLHGKIQYPKVWLDERAKQQA